jgi:hypothetical protein
VLVNFKAPFPCFVEEVFDESNQKNFRILQQKLEPYLSLSQSPVLNCMVWRINEWYTNRQFCFLHVGQISVSKCNLTKKTPSGTNSKKYCLEEVIGVQLVKKFFAFW